MVTLVSIPGQPIDARQPSADDIAAALAAVQSFSDQLAATRVFGFIEPARATASWHPDTRWQSGGGCTNDICGVLAVYLSEPDAWWHQPRTITWCWGVLWDRPDWYEVGWHPDIYFNALKPSWARRLWRVLNRGKGAPPRC